MSTQTMLLDASTSVFSIDRTPYLIHRLKVDSRRRDSGQPRSPTMQSEASNSMSLRRSFSALIMCIVSTMLMIGRQQDIITHRDPKGRLAVLELHTSIRGEDITAPQESPKPCHQTAAPARTGTHFGATNTKLSSRNRMRGAACSETTCSDNSFQPA